MSRPYAHTSHPNLWRIIIYAYSRTWYHRKNNGYNITTLHAYSYSEPLGNTSIRALPTLNHKDKNRRNISAIYAYISLEPLGNVSIRTL
jgi:hypothetical protein